MFFKSQVSKSQFSLLSNGEHNNYYPFTLTTKWDNACFTKYVNVCNVEYAIWGFLEGSDGKKNLPANAGDLGLIPGPGRSPGEGIGFPLQYSCLENSMDRGVWWAIVHGVAKSWTWLKNTFTWYIYYLYNKKKIIKIMQNLYDYQMAFSWLLTCECAHYSIWLWYQKWNIPKDWFFEIKNLSLVSRKLSLLKYMSC